MSVHRNCKEMIRKVKRIGHFFFNYLPSLARFEIIKRIPRTYTCFKYKPQYVVLNITDNCCFKCIMCDQWKATKDNELTTRQWKDIFSQFKAEGIKTVAFSGGEPFLRKDIVELVQCVNHMGMEPVVVTNGYLLNENKIEETVKAGIKSFSVSMDAVGDTFDKIRGIKGAFGKVLDSCEIISQYKKQGLVSAYLYFTIMKETLGAYRDVFAIARKLDFPLVVNLFDYSPYFFANLKANKDKFWLGENDLQELKEFQKFITQNKEENADSVFHTFAEIEYFRKYFKDPLQKNIACVISQQRLGVDSQGNAYGGCWSMGSFGNLKDITLKDIINSLRYKIAHKNMFFKSCPGCSCGYTKNIRNYIPLVFAEVVFRLCPSQRKRIYS